MLFNHSDERGRMNIFRVWIRHAGWSSVITKAEKLVGYSSSYANFQHMLNDEIDQVAMSVRKLISTGHPLLKSAKQLYGGQNFVHLFGLTVLLVSRANAPVPDSTRAQLWNGVLESQSSLAEITELVYTANFVHRGLVNADEMPASDVAKLTMGNKMAILGGDLLLANASVALAKLRDPFVVNEIAQGIADMTVSVFVDDAAAGEIDKWQKRVYLGAGSLLAHACRSAVRLGGQNEGREQAAFDFAKHLSYLSAVIFPLIQLPEQEAQKLALSHGDIALTKLGQFPESEARKSLVDMTELLAQSCQQRLS